jgi:hypothetical protein
MDLALLLLRTMATWQSRISRGPTMMQKVVKILGGRVKRCAGRRTRSRCSPPGGFGLASACAQSACMLSGDPLVLTG